MRIKAVFFSPTGASRKICLAIAASLGQSAGVTPEYMNITTPPGRKSTHAFSPEDMSVFALPVYGGRIPAVAAEYLGRLEGMGSKAVAVVTYGNREFDDALLELKDLLTDKGFQVISCAGFIGEHTYNAKVGAGRPDGNDLSLAEEFAGLTYKKLAAQEMKIPEVRGNQPYKAPMPPMGLAPLTDSGCTYCMICADNCPTGAIYDTDPTAADNTKCIVCFACVKNCPERIKHFESEHLQKAAQWLEGNFTARKEPEFFL